jgi:ArsR family transcriptional regulator
MALHTKKVYEARSRIAKALAHPTRLLLLDALRERDLCVCDLTDLAGADQSTVSKHLALLKDSGLVAVERKGSLNYYSLKCRCMDGFFSCIESVLRENLREQQATVSEAILQ